MDRERGVAQTAHECRWQEIWESLRPWNLRRPYRPLRGLDQHLRSRLGFLENPLRLERARSEPAELPQFDEDLLVSSPRVCCLDNDDRIAFRCTNEVASSTLALQ